MICFAALLPFRFYVNNGFLFQMQVDAIQSCGGQKTNDGRRYRTGGGILFNILKTREPKAYKEIMARGREFEVSDYTFELFFYSIK